MIHSLFAGLSFAVLNILGVKHGFTFSGGFIDYVLNWGLATRPWLIIPVGDPHLRPGYPGAGSAGAGVGEP